MRFSLVLATLAMSTVAFAQQDGYFQIGYAANLNIGDSVVNVSNDGFRGGVFPNPTGLGNICVNTYIFDPQEEEIGCCACLVTPNGLASLSAKADLISNNLTPAVPTSIVIKLIASVPGTTTGTNYTICNPATVNATVATTGGNTVGNLIPGMLAWGATLEPASTPGTYSPVAVPFINGILNTTVPAGTGNFPGGELGGLTQLCNFIQANGTGFGICKHCRLGALAGAKK